MDPTTTLSKIRRLCKEIQTSDTTKQYYNNVEDLMWELSALDNWLTKGGFLPTQWKDEIHD